MIDTNTYGSPLPVCVAAAGHPVKICVDFNRSARTGVDWRSGVSDAGYH